MIKPMKLYIGFDISMGCPEGACLIVAHTVREAKRIGYPEIHSWFDTEWIDMRVNLIKEHVDYLLKTEVDLDKFKAGIPHVIDNPKCCPSCELWGVGEIIDGHCEDCKGSDDYE